MPVPDTERVHRDLLCPRPSHTAPIRYCSSRQQGKGHQRSVHVYSTLLQPCSLKMGRPRLQFPAERWAAKDLRILGLSVSCRETGTECLESTASSQQRCQDSPGWGGELAEKSLKHPPHTHSATSAAPIFLESSRQPLLQLAHALPKTPRQRLPWWGILGEKSQGCTETPSLREHRAITVSPTAISCLLAPGPRSLYVAIRPSRAHV